MAMQTFYLYFRESAIVGCRQPISINRVVYNPATTLLAAAMDAVEAAHAGDHWFQWVNTRADQMHFNDALKSMLGEVVEEDTCLTST